jgi:hypothetical protein
MDYDKERFVDECEEIVFLIREILKNKQGPVIMNSLCFVLAESIFNVSAPENWGNNMKYFFKSVENNLEAFAAENAKVPHDAP